MLLSLLTQNSNICYVLIAHSVLFMRHFMSLLT